MRRFRSLVSAAAGAVSLLALAMAPMSAGAPTVPSAARVASVAVLTTQDFRVAVVAIRLEGRVPPTADVRVAVARRATGSWRELGERRLAEIYFWRTVTGARAVCRFEIATANTRAHRPHVVVQLLLSPSIGCGRPHRIPLPIR